MPAVASDRRGWTFHKLCSTSRAQSHRCWKRLSLCGSLTVGDVRGSGAHLDIAFFDGGSLVEIRLQLLDMRFDRILLQLQFLNGNLKIV
jgi:hypothetical protein